MTCETSRRRGAVGLAEDHFPAAGCRPCILLNESIHKLLWPLSVACEVSPASPLCFLPSPSDTDQWERPWNCEQIKNIYLTLEGIAKHSSEGASLESKVLKDDSLHSVNSFWSTS